jgi:hypothetical protein
LDKSVIGALTVYDRGALDQIAKGFIRSTDFPYVVILDKDRKVLADSGLEKTDLERVEQVFPELLRRDSDADLTAAWPRTGEEIIHLARPGSTSSCASDCGAGHPARRVAIQTRLRMQICRGSGVILAVGLEPYCSALKPSEHFPNLTCARPLQLESGRQGGGSIIRSC